MHCVFRCPSPRNAVGAVAALATGSPEVPADKGERSKATVGVAPDVPKHPDHLRTSMFPLPSRRAARRPRPRSRCTSCRALRHPARNDDLFDVGHLLLGERARAGWRRGRRRTCRGGLCPDCASRRCAPCPLRSASESTGPARQIARRVGVPPAPPGGRRPACRRSAPRSPFSGGARPSMCRFAAGRGRGGGSCCGTCRLRRASCCRRPGRTCRPRAS